MLSRSRAIVFILTVISLNAQAQTKADCLDEVCLEVVHFDSARLNGKIPLKLPESQLLQLLGKPDSVVAESDWECGNYIDDATTVRILFYGRTQFQTSNGIAILYKLNFEDRRFALQLGKCNLQSGVTKQNLKTHFPSALAALDREVQDYNKDGKMKVRMAQTPASEPSSSGWIFYFEGDVLKEVELWWFIC